jgi:hypothetical protein
MQDQQVPAFVHLFKLFYVAHLQYRIHDWFAENVISLLVDALSGNVIKGEVQNTMAVRLGVIEEETPCVQINESSQSMSHARYRTRCKVRGRQKDGGFVLITTALVLVVLLGVAGLAIDIGRVYITKHELQTAADACSLAATLELDGTVEGIQRARSVVAIDRNKWNLHTNLVTSTDIFFAKDKSGPWETTVLDPRGYRYARVTARGDLPTYFLPSSSAKTTSLPLAFLAIAQPTMAIRGDSGAGQEPKNSFGDGLFPFSPYAHDGTSAPHFGLVVGQQYTLRWPSSPRVQNVCPGDKSTAMVELATAGGGEERGFIESTSSDLIRATIEQDFQTVTRTVGESVVMTGGAKQTQLSSLINRINQDTDRTSSTFAEYSSTGDGNGRRLIAAPVNTGYPNYTIVQIGAFLLLPASEYQNGGNTPYCAEYVGSWVQGSTRNGAAAAGAYVAKLIQQ